MSIMKISEIDGMQEIVNMVSELLENGYTIEIDEETTMIVDIDNKTKVIRMTSEISNRLKS